MVQWWFVACVLTIASLVSVIQFHAQHQEAWWYDRRLKTTTVFLPTDKSTNSLVKNTKTSIATRKEPSPPFATSTENLVSKTGGAAIVALVPAVQYDLIDACWAMLSLINLPDNSKAPVILFVEDDMTNPQKAMLQGCTAREVRFELVHFQTDFPKGFDDRTATTSKQAEPKGRNYRKKKWGYHQMIRFFVSKLWDHPTIRPFDTVMRLDADACWTPITRQLPELSNLPGLDVSSQKIVYHPNNVLSDANRYCSGLYEFARDYLQLHNIHVRNPEMWHEFEETWKRSNGDCRLFYNNFEVVNVDFMRQLQVRQWHYALTEQEPFGVFRYRWGDAPIRWLTLAMFAEPSQILPRSDKTSPLKAGAYQHPCTNPKAVPGISRQLVEKYVQFNGLGPFAGSTFQQK